MYILITSNLDPYFSLKSWNCLNTFWLYVYSNSSMLDFDRNLYQWLYIKNMFYFSVEGFRMAKNVVDSNSGKLESTKTRPWPNVFSILGQRRRRWLTLNQHWLNMSWLPSNTRLWSNTGYMLTINPIPDERLLFRPIGHERVYLPLCKVADTPFHIQGGDFLRRRKDLKFWKRRDLAQYYTQFRFLSPNNNIHRGPKPPVF